MDVLAFGRALGTVAPCGCTTEPLGGLAYAFGYLEHNSPPDSRLVVAMGSFLFPDPTGVEAPTDAPGWDQAAQRAEALTNRFARLGSQLVVGVGPTDLASPQSAAAVAGDGLPRVLAGGAVDGAQIPQLRRVTLKSGALEVKAGVTQVLDPDAPGAAALHAQADPVAHVRTQVAAMNDAGLGLTIAMVHGPRALTEQIAREVEGLDIAVVGVVDGTDRDRLGTAATFVGDTFVVEPGQRLQTVTQLRLSVAPGVTTLPKAPKWMVVPPESSRKKELQRLEARLTKFKADPSADPTFIAKLEADIDKLRKGDAPPDAAVVATFEQVKITCKLPVDTPAKAALDHYDGWVAAQNKKRFAGVRPPPADKSSSSYVGIDECATCHDEAAEGWRNTVHAHAYETLELANKQYDLSCVGCHVTGFRRPGGSEVVENQGLVDVQCEVCHGPGSRHVEEPTNRAERPQFIDRQAKAEVCVQCHTAEHSDTFEYEAYLRDVLGAGHGEAARKALGDGPTGASLRKEGLEKAGGSCKKL